MTIPASPPLRAGVASEDITPPAGVRLSGYAGRPRGGNAGCRDRLRASSLYLADEDGRGAVLVTLDVIGLTPADDAALRTRIAARAGVVPDAVMVACSHTHAGPATMPLRATGAQEVAWTERVLERAVRAATAAREGAARAAVGHGGGVCYAAVNRRQPGARGVALGADPEGYCDPACRVLVLEGAGGPLAVVVHYAMHPVVLGNDNVLVSADWVGAMRAGMERALGCPALFLQGCCGDINPRLRGEAACDAVGGDVAGSALSALGGARMMDGPRLGFGAAEAAIPVRPLADEATLARVERAAHETLAAGDGAVPLGARHIAEADLEWAAACRARRRSGDEPDFVPGRVSALSLGAVTLIGLPGEIFAAIGAQVEAALPGVWPVGYANGNLGYLYPDRALDEGGYEVEVAYRLYGEQQADRGTAAALLQAARQAVAAARRP